MKLPGKAGGKKLPKAVVWGGLAVAGVGAFLLFRKSASGGSSSPAAGSTSSSAVDPVTGLPYSQDAQIDPATGMSYLAEAQQYGSVAAAEAAATGSYTGAGGYSGLSSGYVGTSGYPSSSSYDPTAGVSAPASNAQWSQEVESQLTGIGYAPTDVSGAVGRYLANLPLSSTQAGIVQVALAEVGPPPQGSYTIVTQPSSGGATGGGTSTTPPPSGGGGSTGGGSAPAPAVRWQTITAPGGRTLAQLAAATDRSVPWAQVLTNNPWAVKYEGRYIPRGYRVHLPYPG